MKEKDIEQPDAGGMDNPHLIQFLEMLKTMKIEKIEKSIDYNGNTEAIIKLPGSEYQELLFSNGGALLGLTSKTDDYERLYKLINSKLALQDFDIIKISQYTSRPFSLSIEMKEKDIEQPDAGGKKKRSRKRMKSTKKKRHIKKRRYTKKRR